MTTLLAQAATDLVALFPADGTGFDQAVTVGANTIRGIFEYPSAAGGAEVGPMLTIRHSDLVGEAIGHNTLVTVDGSGYRVRGIEYDGAELTARLILRAA